MPRRLLLISVHIEKTIGTYLSTNSLLTHNSPVIISYFGPCTILKFIKLSEFLQGCPRIIYPYYPSFLSGNLKENCVGQKNRGKFCTFRNYLENQALFVYSYLCN